MVMRLRAPYGVEKWGWRLFLVGYVLLALGAGTYYWGQWTSYNVLEDIGLWMDLPGALLLNRRRRRCSASRCCAEGPGRGWPRSSCSWPSPRVRDHEFTSLGNADLPIMFAIAMLASAETRKVATERAGFPPRRCRRHNERVTDTRPPVRPLERGDQDEVEVSPLELFFDLVFVFALTQVTASWRTSLEPRGRAARCPADRMLLWWAGSASSWLCNVVNADEGRRCRCRCCRRCRRCSCSRSAIPEAFDDCPAGSTARGARLAYLAVPRHAPRDVLAGRRRRPALRRQLIRFAPSMLAGSSVVLLVASQFRRRHPDRALGSGSRRRTTSAPTWSAPRAGGSAPPATSPSGTA